MRCRCVLLALLLAGCASTPASHPGSSRGPAASGASNTLATPLRDANIGTSPIPPLLASALEAPYRLPTDRSCAALAAKVKAFDEELGPDLDQEQSEDGNFIGDVASDTLQNTVEGLIPFRGWLRKLSGAESAERKREAALRAGLVRRGYLRGLEAAEGCTPQTAGAHISASEAAPAPKQTSPGGSGKPNN